MWLHTFVISSQALEFYPEEINSLVNYMKSQSSPPPDLNQKYDVEYQDSLNFRIRHLEGDKIVYLNSNNGKYYGSLINYEDSSGYELGYDSIKGEVIYEPKALKELSFVCGNSKHSHTPSLSPKPAPLNQVTAAHSLTQITQNVLQLNSRLGAKHLIYLDFDGEDQLPGWQNYRANKVNVPDSIIVKVWKSVSEDFIGFDVNITTNRALYDSHNTLNKGYVVFAEFGLVNWLGLAHLGSYGTGSPVLVDLPTDFEEEPIHIYRTTSHEIGHALSLSHDGGTTGTYYSGHGEWAPIMGNGELLVSHWSKGDYPMATNTEDDIFIIQEILGPIVDNAQGIQLLEVSGQRIHPNENQGEILNQYDIDTLEFQMIEYGSLLLDISPTYGYLSNLDIAAELYDSSWNQIEQSAPVGDRGAHFNLELNPGVYYIIVDGGGELDLATGFTDYGSFGKYELTGSLGYLFPEPQFSISRQDACTGEEFELKNQSQGTDLTYSWEIEGRSSWTSTEANPKVKLSESGIYLVHLTASNQVGSSKISHQVHIGSIPIQIEVPTDLLDTNLLMTITQNQPITEVKGTQFDLISQKKVFEYCAIPNCYELQLKNLYVPETCGAAVWLKTKSYEGGVEVYFEGNLYRSKWWVKSEVPDQGGAWIKSGECPINDANPYFQIKQNGQSLLGVSPIQLGVNGEFSKEFCVLPEGSEPNISPVAHLDEYKVENHTQEKILDVLLNDSDVNGDPLQILSVYSYNETKYFELENQKIIYQNSFPNQLMDTAFYEITDGELLDTAMILIENFLEGTVEITKEHVMERNPIQLHVNTQQLRIEGITAGNEYSLQIINSLGERVFEFEGKKTQLEVDLSPNQPLFYQVRTDYSLNRGSLWVQP